MDDNVAYVKIEPKQEEEEEIDLSIESNVLVSNEFLATIKEEGNEITTSVECSSKEYNGEEIQQQGHLSQTVEFQCYQIYLLMRNDPNNLKCPNCDYVTNVKQYLKRHLLIHNISKEFKCAICNYVTNVQQNLKSHLLIHNDAKNFKCGICNYATSIKRRLKLHLLKHNSKNFKCNFCDYRTNIRKNLEIHALRHNKILTSIINYNFNLNQKTAK